MAIASEQLTNAGETFSFGRHYAVLNLDLMAALIATVNDTTQGKEFVSNTKRWIDAVHEQNPPPLGIFTRLYYANAAQPELKPDSPFAKLASGLGALTSDNPGAQIDSAFTVKGNDTILGKTRFYAGAGNALEEILRAQGIETVVISGIRTSGVVLSTAYRLFDLDFNIYIISDNVIETPVIPDDPANAAILQQILPKIGLNVITVDQAIKALSRSGPAV